MPTINYGTRELTAKIVYYGPGLCGKTTNLQHIHDTLPADKRTKMLSLATESDRTLFFDFLPLDVGELRGLKVRVQLYTVPGQVFYNETRKVVLKGADGVVFVADSQKEMLDANQESLKNLKENLTINNLDFKEIPTVIQYNKRDLKNALDIPTLDKSLNLLKAPTVEASAKSGEGVHETLKVISRLVLTTLIDKYGTDKEKRLNKEKPAAQAAQVVKLKLGRPAAAPEAEAGGTVAMMSPFAEKKKKSDVLPDLGDPDAPDPVPGGTVAMMSPFASGGTHDNPLGDLADAPAGGTVAMMSPFAASRKKTDPPDAAPKGAKAPPPEADAGGTVAFMSPFAESNASGSHPLLEADSGASGEPENLDSLVDSEPTIRAPAYAPHIEELDANAEVLMDLNEEQEAAPAPKAAKKSAPPAAEKQPEPAAAAPKPAPAPEPAPAAKPKPKSAITGPIPRIDVPPVVLAPDKPQTITLPVILDGKRATMRIVVSIDLDD
jgi:hypothetical protein